MAENKAEDADAFEQRSLTTDAAILLAPALAVAADHYLNRPPKDDAPKVELPPGVDPKK